MHLLLTFGSKRGGTEGIAHQLADALRGEGHTVELQEPGRVQGLRGYDAVIVGGALYAGRWQRDARRFVLRHDPALRRIPVWFFSSGPLDDSAERAAIAPTPQVQDLMDRVGAQGHATFGGRLAPDARGFPASAMARKRAGDWRSSEHIRFWAREIAEALPHATPRAVVLPSRPSLPRLLAHGVAGWVLCALTMGILLARFAEGTALLIHAVAAPAIFVLVSLSYFRNPRAAAPLPTGLAFFAIVAALDVLVVGGLIRHNLDFFTSLSGTWLPLGLIALATLATGEWLALSGAPRHHRPRHA